MEKFRLGIKKKLRSDVLSETREIIVRLPESYLGSNKIYPVFYLLDANYTTFFVKDISTIEFMKFIHQTPEFIIVGVYNTNRDRDTLPVKVPQRDSGGSDKFLEFIEKELIPSINQEYRTSGFNILYGASNSGIFSIYATLKSPELFDVVITPSPMIGWCPELIKELALKRFKIKRTSKLYMIYGEQDYEYVTEYILEFTEFLEKHAPESFRWTCDCLEDEGHVPFQGLYFGLKWVFNQVIDSGS